ncbi:WhiB family transcriptional regulator [Streptomyces sp. NPDC051018]|uniref:WhiB family transcriptional regulator n=1 Tax=Streptomyces sp. NPDC051018 TaxID=3365639 RepID=UPI0037A7EEA6
MRHITTQSADQTLSLRGIADHSWHTRGACHGLEPERADRLFFPLPRDHRAVAEAKSLCGGCPVRKACFDHAIGRGIKEGIWGGLTEAERRPWQDHVRHRLDYTRVRAAFLGRDIALSEAERKALTRHAYVRGWTAKRLAYALQLDLDYARDLMREAAQDVAARDRYWATCPTEETTQDSSEDTGPSKGTDNAPDSPDDGTGNDEAASATPVPVPRHIHTQELVTALGKAA